MRSGPIGRLLFASFAQCVLAAPVFAQAAASTELEQPRFYAGAELGTLHYDDACDPTALSCEHNSGAAAAFGGYRPNPRVALELAYRDLGELNALYPRLTGAIETTGDIDGYDLAARVSFPLGRSWQAFLRGGAFYWQAQTQSPERELSETGWSVAGGGGFARRFWSVWEARLEYEYFDHLGGTETGETAAHVLSFGVGRFFGKRLRPSAGAPASPSAEP